MSPVFHQIVAFSKKLSHIKNCPGWKRDFDFIENTLTGSQVITKKPKSLSRSSLMDLMLHLGVTYLRLGHRTQRGLCGKLTTVTTDVMQVMQLTLTRHARVRTTPKGSSLTHLFVCFFSFFIFPTTFPSSRLIAMESRGVLELMFAGYVPLASQSPYPIKVYFLVSYGPHFSHFLEDVIFAIPT